MGRRRDKGLAQAGKRRTVLQIGSTSLSKEKDGAGDNSPHSSGRSENIQHWSLKSTGTKPTTGIGLLGAYADSDEEDNVNRDSTSYQSSGDVSAGHSNISTSTVKSSTKQTGDLDSKVADFLAEIDALAPQDEETNDKESTVIPQSSADSTTEDTNDSITGSSEWQEVFDANTNCTYYWNTVTNEVSWDIPQSIKQSTSTTEVVTEYSNDDKTYGPQQPLVGPMEEPTIGPAIGPAEGPTIGPTIGPTMGPTVGPTIMEPTIMEPTVGPTMGPTVGPMAGPIVAADSDSSSDSNGRQTAAVTSTEDEGQTVIGPHMLPELTQVSEDPMERELPVEEDGIEIPVFGKTKLTSEPDKLPVFGPSNPFAEKKDPSLDDIDNELNEQQRRRAKFKMQIQKFVKGDKLPGTSESSQNETESSADTGLSSRVSSTDNNISGMSLQMVTSSGSAGFEMDTNIDDEDFDIDQQLELALERKTVTDGDSIKRKMLSLPSSTTATPIGSGDETEDKETKREVSIIPFKRQKVCKYVNAETQVDDDLDRSAEDENKMREKQKAKEEEDMKNEIVELSLLITNKLEFLDIKKTSLTKFQIMLLETETRILDWKKEPWIANT
ncbi:formin-binding protein 4-like [Ptychodera flava]|uniref:formin-binding protein 4-like n=1 Tax=Ptychodera flava TaxID=63121 RepID=UPI00396A128E